jgi:hypothetical protein
MALARKAKKTTPKKNATRKPSAKRKKVTKATKPTKSTDKQKGSTARKKSSSADKSVDSILKTFDKRRTEQQAKLSAVTKKIALLEAKTKAQQAEIVSLKKAQTTAETTIGKLDIDRDQAVRKLLEKLGVNLVGETASAAKKKKTAKKIRKKQPRKKSATPKSSTRPADKTEELQATPLFGAAFDPANSNGNVQPTTEVAAKSASDDELMGDEKN